MFLFELDSPDPLTIRLIAVLNHLKSNVENGKAKADWTTEELLDYLDSNQITLDKSDLYDMVKNPPVNNIISNIQGDNVIFKGQEQINPNTQDADQNKKVVNQMAHDAMK